MKKIIPLCLLAVKPNENGEYDDDLANKLVRSGLAKWPDKKGNKKATKKEYFKLAK